MPGLYFFFIGFILIGRPSFLACSITSCAIRA